MTTKEMAERIFSGDKKTLAKAMTLICSHLDNDKEIAKRLLPIILEKSTPAYRIGISGIGGVGKSTFIEALGSSILESDPNIKLGVLTIDPSSPKTGGSILADSVRMNKLVSSDRVFLRAASNNTQLGGLNREAYELVTLLEAAGCHYIMIETVGSGQSDDRINLLSDLSILLQMPASGDSMQALKKGSIENADLLVIHKNDGLLKKEASKASLLYKQREQLIHSTSGHKETPVFLVSSVEKTGLKELWAKIEKIQKKQIKEHLLEQKRKSQRKELFEEQVVAEFRELLRDSKTLSKDKKHLEKLLDEKKTSPLLAARSLLMNLHI